MFPTTRSRSTAVLAVLVTLVLAGVVALDALATGRGAPVLTNVPASAFTAQEAIAQIEGQDGVLRFDVAEDATRFVWDGDPELTEGKPAQATLFVSQGYIYPDGTLTESNGVLPDGSPEFPDLVLGQWTCYGWWLGDAAHAAQTAPWITTHLFNFGGEWGEATIVTEGYSIDDLEVPLERAITGGSGPYADARGVQRETNLGFNESEGLNFRYEVRVAE